MNVSSAIDEKMLNNGKKIISKPGMFISGKLNPVDEWIKWLSFEPDFEKEKMNEYSSKGIYNLEENELKFINEYNTRKRILPVLKKYNNNESSMEESKEAFNFLTEHSLIKLMLDKLTMDELKEAREKIRKYSSMTYEEEGKLIDEEILEYDSLSMVDSFAINAAFNDFTKKSLKIANDIAKTDINENSAQNVRNRYYAK